MKKLASLIAALLLAYTLPGTVLAAELAGMETAERPTPTVYLTKVMEYHEGGTLYTLTTGDDPALVDQRIQAVSRWVTAVYAKSIALPRTGY